MKNLIVCLFLYATSAWAFAETRYVTDVMYIPMRSGPGNEFRIIHSAIKSGLKMTVVEMPEDSDWAHVQTPSGLDGWIRKQYLIDTPTARLQLSAALEELNVAKSRAKELEQKLVALEGKHSNLSQQAQDTNKTKNQLEEELRNLKTLSADAINLSHRYKDLLAKHDLIQTEFDAVRAENDRLKGEKTINQWLFGAGLVILGMFLMLILPALKPRKRNSEWRD